MPTPPACGSGDRRVVRDVGGHDEHGRAGGIVLRGDGGEEIGPAGGHGDPCAPAHERRDERLADPAARPSQPHPRAVKRHRSYPIRTSATSGR